MSSITACMLGLEGIVFKAQGFAVSFRSLAALDQEQEPERACGEARGRGGVRTMADLEGEASQQLAGP